MIISVNGFEEAKSYPVMFGTSELLMDNNRDMFYIKSVDSMGKYTINSYTFKQVENEQPAAVTQSQFNELQAKLDTLIAALGGNLNGQQHTVNSADTTNVYNFSSSKHGDASAVSAVPTNL